MMKRSVFLYFMVFLLFLGLLSVTSCKRNKVADPDIQGPAGFRIILSGTANPSTLYVPQSEPAVTSHLTVTALRNDGTPVSNKNVIFQDGGFGYFENYEISAVRPTDASGTAHMTYFIPPGANIKAEYSTRITVTLVEDGRLDSAHGLVSDSIPIRLVPYMNEGVVLHGHVLTPAGNGVGEVTVQLVGEEDNMSAVTVTRSSGSYEFYVPGGWYGSIVPIHEGYEISPVDYSFSATNPVITDVDGLDFVAVFEGGNTLLADVETWVVGALGDTTNVNVINLTGDATIGYIVVPSTDWLTVSPSTGSTPGSFLLEAEENTTGLDREGSVLISATDTVSTSITITVNQLSTGVSIDSTLAITPTYIDAPSAGYPASSTTDAASVNVYNSGSDETIELVFNASDDWIILPAQRFGNTVATLGFAVEPNTGPQRTGYIQFTPTTTGVSNPNGVKLTINQDAGPALAVDVATKNVGAGGETFSFWITNSSNGAIPLSFQLDGPTWLKIIPESGIVPAQISVEVNANGTGVSRTTYLEIIATWATDTAWGDVTMEENITITQDE